jgi:hypothetical protein
MGTLRTIGSISRDRHIFCGLTGRRFTQHRQKPARGEGVRWSGAETQIPISGTAQVVDLPTGNPTKCKL